jgi:hypothetical protein
VLGGESRYRSAKPLRPGLVGTFWNYYYYLSAMQKQWDMI